MSAPRAAADNAGTVQAALKTITASEGKWRKLIDQVKIEPLPINYPQGKQLEQNKGIVLQDLNIVARWAAATTEDKNSLVDQVNLMSTLQDFESQLQQFADLLLSYSPNDRASADKILAWNQDLIDLADIQVDPISKTAFLYATGHALQMDKSCVPSRRP